MRDLQTDRHHLKSSKKVTNNNLRDKGVEIPHLLGDLPWDLVSSHRMFVRLLPEAKVEADKSEGERYPDPQA